MTTPAVNRLSVHGSVAIPGDKSLSHRALLFAALASGKSSIANLLKSADVDATRGALESCGVAVKGSSDGGIDITGVGLRGLSQPAAKVDCANSGTTARLFAGVVAGNPISVTLDGDTSLRRRPMLRVAAPLRQMGAGVELSPGNLLPMKIRGGQLRSIEWSSAVASAQVKSAILLAALCGGVPAVVREPALSRDHTERMLVLFGGQAGASLTRDADSLSFVPPSELRPFEFTVPGDPSTAAYFVALAALASHGELLLPGVLLNPTRTGFLAIAERMGASISVVQRDDSGPEPVGTLLVRPSELRGVEVLASEVPAAIDELPLVAALASRAQGVTTIRGATELRVKESDRIATMVSNLNGMGVEAEELEDGMMVRGGSGPLRGHVATHGDHRIAMTFGVLSVLPESEITFDDPSCVAVSFPHFWDALREVTE